MRADERLIECECGRRYMCTIVARDQVEAGFEVCVCERRLGEWSGLVRYQFEPEDLDQSLQSRS
jgi:hypothetical protein